MKGFGILLLIGGALGALSFYSLDTSVAVPTETFMGETIGGGRVNNLGLMADRQNGLLISVGASIVGVLLLLFAPHRVDNESQSSNASEMKCPQCAEWIKKDAKICRFCRSAIANAELASQDYHTISPDRFPVGTVVCEFDAKGAIVRRGRIVQFQGEICWVNFGEQGEDIGIESWGIQYGPERALNT